MSIRTTQVQKIRRRVRDSIRIAKSRGYQIVSEESLNQDQSCCCPLAAVYVAANRLTPDAKVPANLDVLKEVRRMVGLRTRDLGKFLDGFDGMKLSSHPNKYEEFGYELRMELTRGVL